MGFRENNQVKWIGSRPAHNGEQVAESNVANNNTVVLYTVGAGKVLYITDWAIGVVGNFSGEGYLCVRDNLAAVQYEFCFARCIAGVLMRGLTSSTFYPIEVPATWDVAVYSGVAGLTIRGFIHGWVE